jgi:hypothetical protein
MAFGYHFANATMNAIAGFRDRGWEQALRDASDAIVKMGWAPEEQTDQGNVWSAAAEPEAKPVQECASPDFWSTFGCMAPQTTPMLAGGRRGQSAGLSYAA